MTTTLTLDQARRIAVVAQGFGTLRRPRGPVRAEHLWRVIDRVGFVQIDSVNVVTRSHYLPFFSRLGGYDRCQLDSLRDGLAAAGVSATGVATAGVSATGVATAGLPASSPNLLVEYWAHEASLMAATSWPLFGFRMRGAADQSWRGMQEVARRHPQLLADVLEALTESGPMTARALERELAHDPTRERSQWGWNWSWVKHACEHLFWAGRVTSAGRTRQFERRYVRADLVLPDAVWARGPHGSDPLPEPEAFDALVELSARALGVATPACLRDYPRLSPGQAAPSIERLVRRGVLVPVRVHGWRAPAYLHHEAALPDRIGARALLSPFDSLIWLRRRTAALFGFDFRLEIYTPAAQRVHGYYVLPFLYGDRLLARVDLKADRGAGVLRAQAVTWEPAARRSRGAAAALEDQLGRLAHFLGLAHVVGPVEPTAHQPTDGNPGVTASPSPQLEGGAAPQPGTYR